MFRCLMSALIMVGGAGGAESNSARPRHELVPDAAWQINLPDLEPFEASGLLRLSTGQLLAVNNRGPEVFRLGLPDAATSAFPELWTAAFPADQLRRVAKTPNGRYDVEGIACDDQGRLYLCEESQRWILRWDPSVQRVERLTIDWSPVRQFFSARDRNASFEGIAVGNGILYLANERDRGRIIEVNLDRLEVTGSFEVRTARRGPWDTHYSDLAWFDGRLYVLLRDSRAILCVEPGSRNVEAEYDFSAIEKNPEWRYQTLLPFVGNMEGLAIDRAHFWLVTDNNNLPRERHIEDRRPTLFRCPRPQIHKPSGVK
jgi:glutamine cyclotransferase